MVTFTPARRGEVIGERWALLVADGGADQLGGFRIGELAAALAALSPTRPPLARASSAGRAGGVTREWPDHRRRSTRGHWWARRTTTASSTRCW